MCVPKPLGPFPRNATDIVNIISVVENLIIVLLTFVNHNSNYIKFTIYQFILNFLNCTNV
jgi:hypothetical protein